MPLRIPLGGSPMTFRSTSYVECEDSPEGSYFLDRGQVSRRVYVDWLDREQAELDFLGTAEVLDNGSGVKYISRTIPHAFPPKPHMYVQSIPKEQPVSLVGNGADDVADYDLCELTLVYVMPTFYVREDIDVVSVGGDDWDTLPDEGWALEQGYEAVSRYVTRVQRFAGKTFVLNRGMLKDEDSKVIVEGIPYPVTGGEVQYTWHQVPAAGLPTAAWLGYTNVVNDDTFDGYPAGTLLFDGNVEARANPNPVTGQVLFDVTYRFSVSIKVDPITEDVYGHNYIWRLADNGSGTPVLRPKLVTTNGTGASAGTTLFRETTFRRFFRPNPAP